MFRRKVWRFCERRVVVEYLWRGGCAKGSGGNKACWRKRHVGSVPTPTIHASLNSCGLSLVSSHSSGAREPCETDNASSGSGTLSRLHGVHRLHAFGSSLRGLQGCLFSSSTTPTPPPSPEFSSCSIPASLAVREGTRTRPTPLQPPPCLRSRSLYLNVLRPNDCYIQSALATGHRKH